jgi:hypothetical protein
MGNRYQLTGREPEHSACVLWIVVLSLASALAGCSTTRVAPPNPLPALPVIYADSVRTTAPSTEAPIGVNFKTTTQLKLQASQHWANIADDAGKGVLTLLRKANTCSPQLAPCIPVFVRPPANVTQFSRAFYNQLITTLVKSGIPVSTDPNAGLIADIDVQPISFSANRPQYRYAGVATELGPGVWALRDVSTVKPNDPRTVPPTLDALNWFRSEFASGKTPKTEILVTVSVSTRDRYVARTTNAYYISDEDRPLYDQEICSLFSLCTAVSIPEGEKKDKEKEPQQKPRKVLPVAGDCPIDKCIYPSPEGLASTAAPASVPTPTSKKKNR